MPVIALLELRLTPESLDRAPGLLHKILTDTRAFDGCLQVDVLIDADDPAHVMVHETWTSLEHDAAYRQWRASPGGASDLGSILASAPVLTKYLKDDDI